MTIAVVGVILCIIALSIVPQVLNISDMTADYQNQAKELGICQGRLGSLQEEMAGIKGETPHQVLTG